MSLTTSARTIKAPAAGRHAAPMGAWRAVTDRRYKRYTEGPKDWGSHRALTVAEQIRVIVNKMTIAETLTTLRETRP